MIDITSTSLSGTESLPLRGEVGGGSLPIDFLRFATEYCRQVEQTEGTERQEFVQVMLRLLPMLYVGALSLPDVPDTGEFTEPHVTEEDYDYVRHGIARIMGESDTFLEVNTEDFRYSDTPIAESVSENLADIYQPLRNMVEEFRLGYDDAMRTALREVKTAFHDYWGLKLLNTLRPLHAEAFPTR